jgi:hypothetical protein
MLSGQIISSQLAEVLDAAILLWFHDRFEQLILFARQDRHKWTALRPQLSCHRNLVYSLAVIEGDAEGKTCD